MVVSTDDAEIAAVARQYGAEVVWRPAVISGDDASSESALLHTLEHLEKSEDYHPDLLVFLQCTSPLTTSQDIEESIQLLLDKNADTALSVTPFHYFLWKEDEHGAAGGINHDKNIRPLRQQRQPQFLESGAIYLMRVEGFKTTRHRFFGKTVMHVVPPERCFEIDEPVDLVIAESLVREQQSKEASSKLPERTSALVLDFDGVFTDNRVIVVQDGKEGVLCDRGDGWGLGRLKNIGIAILVLSSEANPIVQVRCEKLGLEYRQGILNKLPAMLDWLTQKGIEPANAVYVGNDVNDLDCLRAAGCGAAVADARPEVLREATLVLKSPGGRGAIRELADLILSKLEE